MGSEPSFLTTDPHVASLPVAAPDARRDRHYVRMEVVDQPGVLATVAGALAALDISIERVSQRRSDDGHATLVLTTHPCTPTALATALAGVASTDRSVLPMLDAS